MVFRCTPGGAVAAGRRRLLRLLLGASLFMLALAVMVLIAGRWGQALICAGAAALAFLAWRMSGDLDPLWLTLAQDELTVQMRRQRTSLALASVVARRLDDQERAHLTTLTSAGGVTFASASYESRLLGAFDLHATNLANAVLVEVDAPPDQKDETDRLRWIVTPDDPEGFLRALREATRCVPKHGSAKK
jgi:hypothetical protein